MGHVTDYIKGWDTTIDVDGSGNGSSYLIDGYNGLTIVQLITSPSNEDQTYTVDIFNQDFNLVAFSRTVQGKMNEFITMPMVGRNIIRIREASPTSGSVIVAVRYR